ncbi:GATA-binding factor 6-B [Coprinopsis cinerea okayama7|uniref:GATA-binding factor 6-B n=1 Tax=Coprinopsis cinerea (strain Okayama-7 / 130 / ATCC MYA-4618 / FGSC 9003) TaxID=240176 RepID=A8NI30_COPC7|nr:GATA-binding factor 6-B [Coprinopsis cinerea okayama7\|eukprot:XP_001833892.1 GATA-binding factor 6-B [Coprinopsis cinerea okayama7\
MPAILNLKFKGNKSFVPFSNLNDTEALTKTWKVCTKVASFLEQGQRLENLSWRLWHLQNLIVDTDNAKSKREFRKLSKCMGDKLDKEKGRSIEELEAPDFKRNSSVELIQQRAAEKERLRDAKPGTIKRMQFTFSIDQPTPAPTTIQVRKPNAADASKRKQATSRGASQDNNQQNAQQDATMSDATAHNSGSVSLKFPSIFSSDFGPHALLYPTPTLTNTLNYGEGLNPPTANRDSFSIARPTIELPLDELLHHVDGGETNEMWSQQQSASNTQQTSEDVTMAPPSTSALGPPTTTVPLVSNNKRSAASMEAEEAQPETPAEPETTITIPARPTKKHTRSASRSFSQGNAVASTSSAVPPLSQTVREVLPETVAPSKVNELFSNPAPAPRSSGRPSLTVRTQSSTTTRSSGPGATATNLNTTTTNLRNTGNSAPGGVKAECSNCGATHTPLWRRGLNDELNCNACGLYCKLHKRPRPKSMRNNHGEGRQQVQPRQETVDVMAQCYNCHTTATPLWRKDDEGKTVCNACGLYYKLHGSARPISMKSDVIRKRSRHDARRGNSVEDTASTSPGTNSRRNSPVPEQTQPTLAPDTSTAPAAYDYTEDMDYRHNTSELMNALGTHDPATTSAMFSSAFSFQYPGPYHPDYLVQMYTAPQDPLPFAHVDTSSSSSEHDPSLSPRSSKRRRMSTDSTSEPPQSAVSYNSYNEGFSSASSTSSHSQRGSMDFPYSAGSSTGPALRGSGNTFWHPPMLPQGDEHSQLFHPPMVTPGMVQHTSGGEGHSSDSSGSGTGTTNNSSNNNGRGSSNSNGSGSERSGSNDDSPMDYLHPPMMSQEEELFSAYLHPPMAIPEDGPGSTGVHGGLHFDYGHTFEHDASMRVY